MRKKKIEIQKLMSPVRDLDTGSPHKKPVPGIALCLSGGGYRAMLFHVGSLWRLNEAGLLKKLDRISSVSGGSITAGVLGMNWSKLDFDEKGVAREFVAQVVEPIRTLAGITIDFPSVVKGLTTPDKKISDEVVAFYAKHLFGDATLQDLPDNPSFIINATNVQSGDLWRFTKPRMTDYRVGQVTHPCIPLSVAVAASSAFPPFLSPMTLEFDHAIWTSRTGKEDLKCSPFTTNIVLTDGGVYDNLGLEAVWKLHDTILVSDGGAGLDAEPEPWQDWAMHFYRIVNIIGNQVSDLRKRQVVGSFVNKWRKGAYWGIRSNINHYKLKSALKCPFEKTMDLANISTRLATLDSVTQERLINWGYAVCDAALRKHIDKAHHVPRPDGFVYPNAKV